jgi:hypothetical protein
MVKPPGTLEAVSEIFKANGVRGLYTGGRLHFGEFNSPRGFVFCPLIIPYQFEIHLAPPFISSNTMPCAIY